MLVLLFGTVVLHIMAAVAFAHESNYSRIATAAKKTSTCQTALGLCAYFMCASFEDVTSWHN